ncbi:Putative phospholipase D [Escherichia coli]|uniref:Phospholipase D n=1 Tax=Escherichia coli TaxID=562 RepID=A0A376YFK8_ECOLX|nr:Putative phospholipase D [Escherichia coli]
MGYLHIDGRGMKPNGGSRHNPLEAETIAAWLVAHKDDIERHYGEPLYKVVGVVTPFSAQVNAIKMSLRKLEINGKDEQGLLTVGTVHSLQGRKGRLFSFLLSTQNMKMAGFLIATALSSMLLSHALKIVSGIWRYGPYRDAARIFAARVIGKISLFFR